MVIVTALEAEAREPNLVTIDVRVSDSIPGQIGGRYCHTNDFERHAERMYAELTEKGAFLVHRVHRLPEGTTPEHFLLDYGAAGSSRVYFHR